MSRKKRRHKFTEHHRKARHNGGKSNKENISILPDILHSSWHRLFKTYEPEKIVYIINKFYLDPSYKFICRKLPKE